MLNSLDPDQDLHSVGPDLGPNYLQRTSAEDKKLSLARKEFIEMKALQRCFSFCFSILDLNTDLQKITKVLGIFIFNSK